VRRFETLDVESLDTCRSKLKHPKNIMFKGSVTKQTFQKFVLFITEPAVRRAFASTLDVIPYSVCLSLLLSPISQDRRPKNKRESFSFRHSFDLSNVWPLCNPRPTIYSLLYNKFERSRFDKSDEVWLIDEIRKTNQKQANHTKSSKKNDFMSLVEFCRSNRWNERINSSTVRIYAPLKK
jgi:hypothetical protein